MTSKKATVKSSFGTFFLAIIIFFGLRWIAIEPYIIPSGSMIPALLVNDHILVTKFDFGLRLPFTKIWLLGPFVPRHGEIVVFESVEDPNIIMIKRVTGLAGDRIDVTGPGRRLEADEFAEEGVVTVPEGHIFLLGDNRDNSRDSRYWGSVPLKNLIGMARVVWLACDKTISDTSFICDPRYIHWHRIFSRIE